MLAGIAQVGVDQQGARAELREHHGEIGGDEAAALLASRAQDGERLARGLAILSAARKEGRRDRKSTRLNSSHVKISYAVFCLKKKKNKKNQPKYQRIA